MCLSLPLCYTCTMIFLLQVQCNRSPMAQCNPCFYREPQTSVRTLYDQIYGKHTQHPLLIFLYRQFGFYLFTLVYVGFSNLFKKLLYLRKQMFVCSYLRIILIYRPSVQMSCKGNSF